MPYPGGKSFPVEEYMAGNKQEQDFSEQFVEPWNQVGIVGKRAAIGGGHIIWTQKAGEYRKENSHQKGQIGSGP